MGRTKGHVGYGKNYKGVYHTYFKQLKNGALKRQIPFNITFEQIGDLWEKQPICAYSNISLKQRYGNKDKCFTASLDRIDSSKGYQIQNIQWVHKIINKMKGSMSHEEFKNIIKLIRENDPENLHK
ncbi:MAG: hypothetical protein ABIP51_18050 [Bacteroidia bacterium]